MHFAFTARGTFAALTFAAMLSLAFAPAAALNWIAAARTAAGNWCVGPGAARGNRPGDARGEDTAMPTLLITGANRGIGLALTSYFAAKGWRVHAWKVPFWQHLRIRRTIRPISAAARRRLHSPTRSSAASTPVERAASNRAIAMGSWPGRLSTPSS